MTEEGWAPHREISHDPETNTYRVSYRSDDHGALVGAIIDLVAAVTGEDPTAMTPLYEAVDAEALEALFRPQNGSSVEVVFQYCECEVTAMSHGEVVVGPVGDAA